MKNRKNRISRIIAMFILFALVLPLLPATAKALTYGDVNMDGKVSARDASVVLQYDVKLITELTDKQAIAADVNRDGKINSADAAMILRIDVKLAPLPDEIPEDSSSDSSEAGCSHSLTAVSAKEATCAEAGNTAYWLCTDCGKYFSDSQAATEIELQATVIPAKGHSFTAVAAKAASCLVDGNIAYWYCSVCQKYFSNVAATVEISLEATIIHAPGHTIVVDEAVAPDYEHSGLTEGSHCSVCDTVIVPQSTVPALTASTHSITYKNLKTATVPVEYMQYVEHLGFDLPENIIVDGYKFEGWYDMPEGGTKIIYIRPNSTEDYVLYAHWSLINYKITYNEAPRNNNPLTYTIEDELILSDPVWDGMLFVEWVIGASDDTNRTKIDKIKLGTTGDLQLTAVWKQKKNLAIPQTNDRPLLTEINSANGKYYFIYELGTIQNVVLDDIKSTSDYAPYDLYIKTNSADRVLTISQSVSINENRATGIAKTVSNSVTKTNEWSLNREFASHKSNTNNWNVSSEVGTGDMSPVSAKLGLSFGQSGTEGSSTSVVTASGGSGSTGNEESLTVSSTVEYGTVLNKEKEASVTVHGDMPDGFYAYVHAGNIKVYAVAVYDIINSDYTLTTFNVLENTYELLLYTRDANELNSQNCEALSYDIPMDEVNKLAEAAHYISYNVLTQDTSYAQPADVVNDNSNTFIYNGTETLSFNDPTRGQYDMFLGWYTDASFTTRVDEAWINNWYNNPNNITLFAKWDLAIYYNTLEGTPKLGVVGERTRVAIDWSAYPAGTYDYRTAIDSDGDGKRDEGGNLQNYNIDIDAPITEVFFIGNPAAEYKGVRIVPCSYTASQKLTVHFKNFNCEGSLWAYNSEAFDLVVDIDGKNCICHEKTVEASAAICRIEKITFIGNGTLNVFGASGADATSVGGNGGNGCSALAVGKLTVNMTGTLNLYGGDGGNGAIGQTGSAGTGHIMSTSSAYVGGSDGGRGGNGGNGGIGARALSLSDKLTVMSGNLVTVDGDGGNGGNGGVGGAGGNGTTARGGDLNNYAGAGTNGGTGGNGGNGGTTESVNIASKEIYKEAAFVTIAGENGNGGAGGNGGVGGNGGDGMTDATHKMNGDKYPGIHGASGGNGGRGGNGGNGTTVGKAGSGGAKGIGGGEGEWYHSLTGHLNPGNRGSDGDVGGNGIAGTAALAISYANLSAVGVDIYGVGVDGDKTFLNGSVGFEAYDNNGVGVNLSCAPSSSDNALGLPYEMQVRSVEGAHWNGENMGGYVYEVRAYPNKTFYYTIYAKIPEGYSIGMVWDSIGPTSKVAWLTDNAGTGEWQWYVGKIVCGDSGTFTWVGYTVVYKTSGTADMVEWRVGYSNIIEVN